MDQTIAKLMCLELMDAIQTSRISERMNTNSAYVARRFCSSCCREWGDMDLLLDLIATRRGQPRIECYLDLCRRGLVRFGACCNRALFPCQHNLTSLTRHGAQLIGCNLPGSVPSALTLTSSRQRIRSIVPLSGQLPVPLDSNTTLEAIEKCLEH